MKELPPSGFQACSFLFFSVPPPLLSSFLPFGGFGVGFRQTFVGLASRSFIASYDASAAGGGLFCAHAMPDTGRNRQDCASKDAAEKG